MEAAQAPETYILSAMFRWHQSEQQTYALEGPSEFAEFSTLDQYWLIPQSVTEAVLRVFEPIVVQNEATFERLRQQWHEERGATSSITEMAMCPSYQRIIAMGPAIVPTILRQMEQEGDEPDMWFWALQVLTDADPVSDDDRGDIVKMAQAWLGWACGRYAW
jgi:hypothetical protein